MALRCNAIFGVIEASPRAGLGLHYISTKDYLGGNRCTRPPNLCIWVLSKHLSVHWSDTQSGSSSPWTVEKGRTGRILIKIIRGAAALPTEGRGPVKERNLPTFLLYNGKQCRNWLSAEHFACVWKRLKGGGHKRKTRSFSPHRVEQPLKATPNRNYAKLLIV